MAVALAPAVTLDSLGDLSGLFLVVGKDVGLRQFFQLRDRIENKGLARLHKFRGLRNQVPYIIEGIDVREILQWFASLRITKLTTAVVDAAEYGPGAVDAIEDFPLPDPA